MKLIIQIPCYNEEQTLAATVADLPRTLPGIDAIEYLVIDDGSQDRTSEIALTLGVHHIVRHKHNRGLAAAFQSGLNQALKLGADIIVNTDADNQYCGADISRLVEPLVAGTADIVVGDRGVAALEKFSPLKRWLQRAGSWVVERAAGIPIPDATSGFRAFSRTAALQLTVLSEYTYTLETLIQAGVRGMSVVFMPIHTNPDTRSSRLIRSVPSFMALSAVTILRFYSMYRPLRVFMSIGLTLFAAAIALGVRFLYFYIEGRGSGHIQSLILATIFSIVGVLVAVMGLLADSISLNRKISEEILFRIREREMAESMRQNAETSAEQEAR